MPRRFVSRAAGNLELDRAPEYKEGKALKEKEKEKKKDKSMNLSNPSSQLAWPPSVLT